MLQFSLTVAFLFVSLRLSLGDANSWLKPSSGNWEEPFWSQGVLPNYGHSVMITNAGWKAVQIAPSTSQYFPDSLTVYSLTVASPVDSYNTLLLNYAGFDHPLTANYSITVGPGAAITMFNSALHLNGPTGVGLSIGGEFNQNDSSHVFGNQADVGWAGAGVYNFNNGTIQLEHLYLGGPNRGVFNQNGGSNSPGILHCVDGGTYNLHEGDFSGTTYTSDNTVFRQDGGRVFSYLQFHGGTYILNNGVNYGGVGLGVYGEYRKGSASAVQNGGRMYGPIGIGGEYEGSGGYTISNGLISVPSLNVGMFSGFHQYGGTVTTPSTISLQSGYYDRGGVAGAFFSLDGGFLSSTGISLDTSTFVQTGGTNQVAGSVFLWRRLGRLWARYELKGGVLIAESTGGSGGGNGGFFQSGGVHRVQNLGFGVDVTYPPTAYDMSGGQLIASNISIAPRAVFNQTGGTIVQSGTITLNFATLNIGPGTQQFGALQLGSTNTIAMPSNVSCVARFKNSSPLSWGASTALIIDNWAGSYLGNGAHRIIFGNNSAALTPQQLAMISFRNPAGLAYGTYSTKILSTGEIVPDGLPPTGHNSSRIALLMRPDSRIQVTVTGDPGYDYGVLVSYDLANWNLWTNRVATNGSFSVVEPYTVYDGWPYRRFYKAVLMR